MRKNSAFGSYHPTVQFLFFAVVLSVTMFSSHPTCLVISLFSAVSYLMTLKGAKATGSLFLGVLPLLLLTALINAAFNHAGQTVLCYLPSGNPLTLESILYGLYAGGMLVAVLTWFACFTETVTSDKFLYLFGRVTPSLSLLISMTLGYVPVFRAEFRRVRDAQATLGRDTKSGPLHHRIRNAVICFSVVVTWSMEHAVEKSDSMKSRGYGAARRTSYTVFRFEERDRMMLVLLFFCGLFLLCGGISGNLGFRFFPTVRGNLYEPLTVLLQLAYLLLCLFPLYIDRKEERTWKRLRSKI